MMVLIAVIVIGVGPHGRHIRLTLPQHASPRSDKDLAFRGRNGSDSWEEAGLKGSVLMVFILAATISQNIQPWVNNRR